MRFGVHRLQAPEGLPPPLLLYTMPATANPAAAKPLLPPPHVQGGVTAEYNSANVGGVIAVFGNVSSAIQVCCWRGAAHIAWYGSHVLYQHVTLQAPTLAGPVLNPRRECACNDRTRQCFMHTRFQNPPGHWAGPVACSSCSVRLWAP